MKERKNSEHSQRIPSKEKRADKVDNRKGLSTNVRKELSRGILEVCFVLVLTRALPLAVYTVMVSAQRYHLFVWTVFSPKLLYEGLHTVVVSILVLIFLLIRVLLS